MNTEKIEKKSTLMVAHRGASGLEPENSIPAFVAAAIEVILELRQTFM